MLDFSKREKAHQEDQQLPASSAADECIDSKSDPTALPADYAWYVGCFLKQVWKPKSEQSFTHLH